MFDHNSSFLIILYVSLIFSISEISSTKESQRINELVIKYHKELILFLFNTYENLSDNQYYQIIP